MCEQNSESLLKSGWPWMKKNGWVLKFFLMIPELEIHLETNFGILKVVFHSKSKRNKWDHLEDVQDQSRDLPNDLTRERWARTRSWSLHRKIVRWKHVFYISPFFQKCQDFLFGCWSLEVFLLSSHIPHGHQTSSCLCQDKSHMPWSHCPWRTWKWSKFLEKWLHFINLPVQNPTL